MDTLTCQVLPLKNRNEAELAIEDVASMHDHTSPHLHSTMAVPRGVQAYRCTGWGYSSAVLTFSTRLFSSSSTCSRKYDAVIVGGGRNVIIN